MSPGGNNIRAAVIGLGGMGRRHLQSISQAGFDIVAVCDASAGAVSQAMESCAGQPEAFGDWRVLLEQAKGRLDVVTIATNGPSHCDIAVAAARSGVRHILCEKPMATSGRAAREMARVCQETGARLAINLSRRFADRFIRLKALLLGGAIGEIRHVNVSVGAGGLGCIGTHYFDCVAWLADTTPEWVVGQIDRAPAPNVRGPQFFDPGGRGLVGYTNGMTACFQLLGDVAITPLMQIVGTDGYVDFDGWSPPANGRATVFSRPVSQRSSPKTRFVTPEKVEFDMGEPLDVVAATRACLEDLVGAHREGTVEPGIASVDMVMAFHISAQRNWAKVEMPLKGADLQFEVAIT